jgi:putative tryptophan/tyrosine transport system substrate-binding protein
MSQSRRRILLAAVAASAAPLVARVSSVLAAPPADRTIRIGKLTSGEPPRWKMINDSFRDALRELGYVEGKNFVLVERTARYPDPRMADYANEMAQANFDVIVTSCMWTTGLAMKATSTIPIVIGGVHDPLGKGFVKNIARPTGNVTGYSANFPSIGPKMLEFLVAALPEAKTIGVLANPKGPYYDDRQGEMHAAGRAMKLHLVPIDMHRLTNREVTQALFRELRLQALTFVPDDDLYFSYLDRIVPVSEEMRIPTLYPKRDFVDLGGFMSYGPDYVDIMKQTARYVDRLLNGAKPGDLPVEQPVKLEFAINMKKVQALGYTIPRAALMRADYLLR